MFLRLLAAFTLIPLVELYLLIQVGSAIGPGLTILLVITTGVVGATLAKAQGLRVLQRIQLELHSGRMPADSLIDGMLILGAGLLLLTPGLLTDVVGFLLLTPPGRLAVRRGVARGFRRMLRSGNVSIITVDGWVDDN